MRILQVNASPKNVKSEREFTSKVKRLSVQTDDAGSSFSWLFTDEQLRKTPSASCGVSHNQEFVFRQKQTLLMEILGQKCGLTSLALNTSFVYRHRFYMFRAVKSYPWIHAAIGFIFAAGKVEESVQKLKHLIRITIDILRHNKHVQFMDKRDKLTYEMDCEWRKKIETLWKNNCDVESTAYLEMRRTVIVCEKEIFAAVGFHIHIVHPHTFVVRMCGLLGADKIKDVSKYAYDLATSCSQLTLLCLKYKPELIATVCLNIAANFHSVKFVCMKDSAVQWYQVYDQTIDIKEIEAVSEEFLSLLNSNEFVPTWMTSLTRAHRCNPRKVPVSAKGMVSPASSSSHHNRSHQPNQSSSHGRDTIKIAPPTTSSASSHPEQQGGQTSSPPSTSKSIASNGSHHRSVSGNPEALGHTGKDSSHSSEKLPSATSLPSPSGAIASSSFVPSFPSQHSTSSLPSENRSHSGSSAGHPLSPSSARCDPNRVYGKHRPYMSDARRSGRSMPSPDVQSHKSHTRFKHSSSPRPLESSTHNPPPKLPTSPVVKQPSPIPQISKSAVAPKVANMSMPRKMSLAEYRKRVRTSPAAPSSASDILTEDSGFGSTGEVVDSASSVDRKVKGGLKTQLNVPRTGESSSYSKGGQQVNGHDKHRKHHHSHNHRKHLNHKSKKHSSQHSCSRHKHSSKCPSSSTLSYEDEQRPSKSSRLDNPSHSQTTSASGEMHRSDSAIVDSRYESSPRSFHNQNSGFSIDDAFSSTLPCNIFDEDDDPSDIARPMTPIPDSVGTPSQHSGFPHERSPKRPLSALSSDSEDEQCPSKSSRLDNPSQTTSASGEMHRSDSAIVDSRYESSPRSFHNQNSGFSIDDAFLSTLPCNIFDEDDDPSDIARPMTPIPDSVGMPSQHSGFPHERSPKRPLSALSSDSEDEQCPFKSSRLDNPSQTTSASGEMHRSHSAIVDSCYESSPCSLNNQISGFSMDDTLPYPLPCNIFDQDDDPSDTAHPMPPTSDTDGMLSQHSGSPHENSPMHASSSLSHTGLNPSSSRRPLESSTHNPPPKLPTSPVVKKTSPTPHISKSAVAPKAANMSMPRKMSLAEYRKRVRTSPAAPPSDSDILTEDSGFGSTSKVVDSASSVDRKVKGGLKTKIKVPRTGESSSYSEGGQQVHGHDKHRKHHHSHNHRKHHNHKSKKHSSQHLCSRHKHSSKRPSSSFSYEDDKGPSKSSRLDNPSHSQTTSASGEMHRSDSAIVDSRYESSARSLHNQNSGFSIDDAFSSTLPCNIFNEDDDPSDIARPMTPIPDSVGTPSQHSGSPHERSPKRPLSSLSSDSEDEQCPSKSSCLDNPSHTTSTSGEMHRSHSAIVDSRYESSPCSLNNQISGFSMDDTLPYPLPCNIFDQDDDPSDTARPMPPTSDADAMLSQHSGSPHENSPMHPSSSLSHTGLNPSSSPRPLESSTHNPPPKLPTSPVVKQPSPIPQISKSAVAPPTTANMSMPRKISLAEYRKRVRTRPAAPPSDSDILTEDSGFGSTSEVVDSASSVDRKVKGD